MHESSKNNFFAMPTTQWSLVRRAANGDLEGHEAVAQLLARYVPAIRRFLLATKRASLQEIDDILQGFIHQKIFEQQLFASADQKRGRFRALLLTTLCNYVATHRRLQNQSLRHGGVVSIDAVGEPISNEQEPRIEFDVAWARQLLDLAVNTMQSNCTKQQRPDIWMIFEGRLLLPILDAVEPVPYKHLMKQCGLSSEAQAANLLISGKRMFVRILRSLISEYEMDEAAVDNEIRELRQILSYRGA